MKRIFTDLRAAARACATGQDNGGQIKTLPLITLMKRIFTDLRARAIGQDNGVQSKTLPLITLIKRIFTDLQREENGPERLCESDEDDCDRARQDLEEMSQ